MQIHKEGFKIVLIAFVTILVLNIASWMLFQKFGITISLIITIPLLLFILRFFRVPNRNSVNSPNGVTSPCDGKVVVIEEVYEPEFLKEKCIQISVFMSVWNVHINWYPIDGQVIYQKYHPGKFLLAWHPKSSTLNERTTVVVQRPDSVKVLFRQIAGLLARRIVCYSKANDNAKQGNQMGFIKFGSRVDIFIPLNSEVLVKLDQKVVGKQTIIANIT
jgi:phosphatidylserine decarboxylase